jgi:hypothetical protein
MCPPVLLYNFMEIAECMMEAAYERFIEGSVFKLERYWYASYNAFRD